MRRLPPPPAQSRLSRRGQLRRASDPAKQTPATPLQPFPAPGEKRVGSTCRSRQLKQPQPGRRLRPIRHRFGPAATVQSPLAVDGSGQEMDCLTARVKRPKGEKRFALWIRANQCRKCKSRRGGAAFCHQNKFDTVHLGYPFPARAETMARGRSPGGTEPG